MTDLPAAALQKLETAQNIWLASVRPDSRPHLTPVWFAWASEKLYVSIDPAGVKHRNLQANPLVALALEDGLHPVICEGRARLLAPPLPEEMLQIFRKKYEWDINQESQYNQVYEVEPVKWLNW
jgi:nitroimidazol reductase NimA-like FMN-containing flavoprotein (pyridoxamine 5'-phosphate oxidase superfamily)